MNAHIALDRGWNCPIDPHRETLPDLRAAYLRLLDIIRADLADRRDDEYYIRVWTDDAMRFKLDLLGNAQDAAYALTGALRRMK